MSFLDHSDMSERESEDYARYEELKQKLREYLRRPSNDGRSDRAALRKELASLVGAEYNDKEARIK